MNIVVTKVRINSFTRLNLWDKEDSVLLDNVAFHFLVCSLALALSVLQYCIHVEHVELEPCATEFGWQHIERSYRSVNNKLVAMFTCFHTSKQDSLTIIRKSDLGRNTVVRVISTMQCAVCRIAHPRHIYLFKC